MTETREGPAVLSPWWRHATILVMVGGFSVLSGLTVLTYTNAPPIPSRVTDAAGATFFDREAILQPVPDPGEEAQRVRAIRLGRLPEAGQIERDHTAMGLERRERLAPRFGEPPEPVDQEGGGPLARAHVVDLEPVQLPPSQPNASHAGRGSVSRRQAPEDGRGNRAGRVARRR